MPTGYTAGIEDGKITTFRQYALQCARAFGALIEMRDESWDKELPKEILPSNYYADALKEAQATQTELAGLDNISWRNRYDSYKLQTETANEKRRQENVDSKARYQSILSDVSEWEPPTPDHINMKEFMIEQIKISLPREAWQQAVLGFDAWKMTELAEADRDIKRCANSYAEEVERAKGRNEWLQALYKSLEAKP